MTKPIIPKMIGTVASAIDIAIQITRSLNDLETQRRNAANAIERAEADILRTFHLNVPKPRTVKKQKPPPEVKLILPVEMKRRIRLPK